jgi:APA family basic amino acid/polyamine antiporter
MLNLPILPAPEPGSLPRRPMGPLHVTTLVVGIIIGAAIFVQPAEINRNVPNVPGVLAEWIRTGGVYVFLRETLSPVCGFLWGWAMFWSAHSGIIAASSVILARYVGYFVKLDDFAIRADLAW